MGRAGTCRRFAPAAGPAQMPAAEPATRQFCAGLQTVVIPALAAPGVPTHHRPETGPHGPGHTGDAGARREPAMPMRGPHHRAQPRRRPIPTRGLSTTVRSGRVRGVTQRNFARMPWTDRTVPVAPHRYWSATPSPESACAHHVPVINLNASALAASNARVDPRGRALR